MALPQAFIAWVSMVDKDPYSENLIIVNNLIKDVPLYLNTSREKLVTNLRVQNQGLLHDRLLSGTAIFLSI